MIAFFHGWRRKTGCVVLLLACVFAAAWVSGNVDKEGYQISFLSSGDARMVFSSNTNDVALYRLIYRHSGGRVTGQAQMLLSAPHLFIAPPLALLSAFLLLAKKRPVKRDGDDIKLTSKGFATP